MIDPKEAPPGYYAAPCQGPLTPSCTGCDLEHGEAECTAASCTRRQRKDGENVVFVKEPT